MTMQAVFHGTVIAESDHTTVVEGNHYFPEESIREDYFTPTRMRTLCLWKGVASYYTVTVDGARAENVAWQYRRPSPLVRKIKGHVAFYPQVRVVEASATTRKADH
ncbi:MAG: DUF427 domain-containing protein [Nocardioidaceae bacterium]